MLVALALFFASLCGVSTAVLIRLGDYQFQLSDVTQLKGLMDDDMYKNSRFSFSAITDLCNNPSLLDSFRSICSKTDAPYVFLLLKQIAANPYSCEICAFSSCVGCTAPGPKV
ncbi:guanylin-like [Amblyraja radiata]|uniref:guanylin-like n=1 Tax=Amblyraja radiata TaxID=386614 RepID=UPI001404146B|nr:guanylin-like [Amblyraja radiata]